MTPHERSHLEDVYFGAFGMSYYIPPTSLPFMSKTFVTLFNPIQSPGHLLHSYEQFGKDNVIPNCLHIENVDIDNLYQFHRQYDPYFFRCSLPGTYSQEMSLAEKHNTAGILSTLRYGMSKSLTLAEAIIYDIFFQSKGEYTGFPGYSIVTATTDGSYDLPMMIGFDEEDIINRLGLFSSTEALKGKCVYKTIISSKAA
jgi:hypothetical protein